MNPVPINILTLEKDEWTGMFALIMQAARILSALEGKLNAGMFDCIKEIRVPFKLKSPYANNLKEHYKGLLSMHHESFIDVLADHNHVQINLAWLGDTSFKCVGGPVELAKEIKQTVDTIMEQSSGQNVHQSLDEVTDDAVITMTGKAFKQFLTNQTKPGELAYVIGTSTFQEPVIPDGWFLVREGFSQKGDKYWTGTQWEELTTEDIESENLCHYTDYSYLIRSKFVPQSELIIPKGWFKVTGGVSVEGDRTFLQGSWMEISHSIGEPFSHYSVLIRPISQNQCSCIDKLNPKCPTHGRHAFCECPTELKRNPKCLIHGEQFVIPSKKEVFCTCGTEPESYNRNCLVHGMYVNKQLTFAEVSTVNLARCLVWHQNENRSWTVADWAMATAGEFGELCNILKKLNRIKDGLPGNEFSDNQVTVFRELIMEEIGGTYLYLDLLTQCLADEFGFTIADCVKYEFNRVSERNGFEAYKID